MEDDDDQQQQQQQQQQEEPTQKQELDLKRAGQYNASNGENCSLALLNCCQMSEVDDDSSGCSQTEAATTAATTVTQCKAAKATKLASHMALLAWRPSLASQHRKKHQHQQGRLEDELLLLSQLQSDRQQQQQQVRATPKESNGNNKDQIDRSNATSSGSAKLTGAIRAPVAPVDARTSQRLLIACLAGKHCCGQCQRRCPRPIKSPVSGQASRPTLVASDCSNQSSAAKQFEFSRAKAEQEFAMKPTCPTNATSPSSVISKANLAELKVALRHSLIRQRNNRVPSGQIYSDSSSGSEKSNQEASQQQQQQNTCSRSISELSYARKQPERLQFASQGQRPAPETRTVKYVASRGKLEHSNRHLQTDMKLGKRQLVALALLATLLSFVCTSLLGSATAKSLILCNLLKRAHHCSGSSREPGGIIVAAEASLTPSSATVALGAPLGASGGWQAIPDAPTSIRQQLIGQPRAEAALSVAAVAPISGNSEQPIEIITSTDWSSFSEAPSSTNKPPGTTASEPAGSLGPPTFAPVAAATTAQALSLSGTLNGKDSARLPSSPPSPLPPVAGAELSTDSSIAASSRSLAATDKPPMGQGSGRQEHQQQQYHNNKEQDKNQQQTLQVPIPKLINTSSAGSQLTSSKSARPHQTKQYQRQHPQQVDSNQLLHHQSGQLAQHKDSGGMSDAKLSAFRSEPPRPLPLASAGTLQSAIMPQQAAATAPPSTVSSQQQQPRESVEMESGSEDDLLDDGTPATTTTEDPAEATGRLHDLSLLASRRQFNLIPGGLQVSTVPFDTRDSEPAISGGSDSKLIEAILNEALAELLVSSRASLTRESSSVAEPSYSLGSSPIDGLVAASLANQQQHQSYQPGVGGMQFADFLASQQHQNGLPKSLSAVAESSTAPSISLPPLSHLLTPRNPFKLFASAASAPSFARFRPSFLGKRKQRPPTSQQSSNLATAHTSPQVATTPAGSAKLPGYLLLSPTMQQSIMQSLVGQQQQVAAASVARPQEQQRQQSFDFQLEDGQPARLVYAHSHSAEQLEKLLRAASQSEGQRLRVPTILPAIVSSASGTMPGFYIPAIDTSSNEASPEPVRPLASGGGGGGRPLGSAAMAMASSQQKQQTSLAPATGLFGQTPSEPGYSSLNSISASMIPGTDYVLHPDEVRAMVNIGELAWRKQLSNGGSDASSSSSGSQQQPQQVQQQNQQQDSTASGSSQRETNAPETTQWNDPPSSVGGLMQENHGQNLRDYSFNERPRDGRPSAEASLVSSSSRLREHSQHIDGPSSSNPRPDSDSDTTNIHADELMVKSRWPSTVDQEHHRSQLKAQNQRGWSVPLHDHNQAMLLPTLFGAKPQTQLDRTRMLQLMAAAMPSKAETSSSTTTTTTTNQYHQHTNQNNKPEQQQQQPLQQQASSHNSMDESRGWRQPVQLRQNPLASDKNLIRLATQLNQNEIRQVEDSIIEALMVAQSMEHHSQHVSPSQSSFVHVPQPAGNFRHHHVLQPQQSQLHFSMPSWLKFRHALHGHQSQVSSAAAGGAQQGKLAPTGGWFGLRSRRRKDLPREEKPEFRSAPAAMMSLVPLINLTNFMPGEGPPDANYNDQLSLHNNNQDYYQPTQARISPSLVRIQQLLHHKNLDHMPLAARRPLIADQDTNRPMIAEPSSLQPVVVRPPTSDSSLAVSSAFGSRTQPLPSSRIINKPAQLSVSAANNNHLLAARGPKTELLFGQATKTNSKANWKVSKADIEWPSDADYFPEPPSSKPNELGELKKAQSYSNNHMLELNHRERLLRPVTATTTTTRPTLVVGQRFRQPVAAATTTTTTTERPSQSKEKTFLSRGELKLQFAQDYQAREGVPIYNNNVRVAGSLDRLRQARS